MRIKNQLKWCCFNLCTSGTNIAGSGVGDSIW